MENLQFNGDDGAANLSYSNKSTISGSNTFIYWSKALEEHFPSHHFNKPLVNHFGTSIIKTENNEVSDNESIDFSEKWANSYLKKLGIYYQIRFFYFPLRLPQLSSPRSKIQDPDKPKGRFSSNLCQQNRRKEGKSQFAVWRWEIGY